MLYSILRAAHDVNHATTEAQEVLDMTENNASKNASAQILQTSAPVQIIEAPQGFVYVKEIGKDEIRDLIKRAGLEVEYLNKSENPARTLTLSSELKRFVCAVLVKFPSRKASFVIGNESAVIVSAENIESDYLKFAAAFESAAKKLPICKLRTVNYIRPDGSTFRRAKVALSQDAPFFAKEVK